MAAVPQRVTQRTIAQMAGVSQTTVSLVLNGKADVQHRIPEQTRERVLAAIRSTTYVADPVARSLAGARNDLIGVFTYEPAFPSGAADFYTELLTGIESAAEHAGADLLVFTSSPVEHGRRRLLHQSSRLRLADGCLLLGREMDADELEQLVDSGYPFVTIGRRAAAQGRVPYVGADYRPTARELARRAVALGHRRVALLHRSLAAEASADRREGVIEGLGDSSVLIEHEVAAGGAVDGWRAVQSAEPTALFVEEPLDAVEIREHLAATGVQVPRALSLVALGDTGRLGRADDLTRLSAPRAQLGATAVAMLSGIIATGPTDRPPQTMLPCAIEDGATLVEAAA